MRSIAYTEDVESLPGRGARAMRSIAYTEDVESLPGRGARAMRSIAYTEDVFFVRESTYCCAAPRNLIWNRRFAACRPHAATAHAQLHRRCQCPLKMIATG